MNTSLTGRAEGVQSVALDRVDKPPSLHTSLPVLRRVSVSAADRSTLVRVPVKFEVWTRCACFS